LVLNLLYEFTLELTFEKLGMKADLRCGAGAGAEVRVQVVAQVVCSWVELLEKSPRRVGEREWGSDRVGERERVRE